MRLRDLYRDRAVWLYVVITAAFFYRPLTTQTFFFRDLYLLFYGKKALLASALRDGTFPLWDPFTNGGQPYLAMPTVAAMHPSNILYLLLPPIVAFNLIPVLHVLFCAIAAYWLARVVGLSQIAAFATGIAYAFAGVALSAINLHLMLLALPWIPMTIGLAHRRSLVPAAIAAAMPLYSGAAEVAAMLFVLLIVWMTSMRRPAVAAIVIAGAMGLSLPATLPATSVIAQSARGNEQRSYESFTSWSVHPRRLPELVIPQYFGPTNTIDDSEYRGKRWETKGFPYVLSIYFGVPVLLLAGFGVGPLRPVAAEGGGPTLPRRAMAIIAVIALLLSLGRYLPGFQLLYELPLISIFRYPVKALVLALLPLALLAGCGAERIAADRRNSLLIAAVMTVDLLAAGWPVNTYAPRTIFDEPPLARVVRETVGPLRLYSAPRRVEIRAPSNDVRWFAQWQLFALDDYTAATFGIPVVFHSDYDQLAPHRIAQMTRAVHRMRWPEKRRLLDVAGVRAFLTLDEVKVPGVVEVTRIDTASGPLRLYRNDHAYAAKFEGTCIGGSARVVRRELNAARYEVDAPCDGRVVFSENHYDGWRATVDGRDVPHIRARFAFTSVAVTKGHHVIERRYFPPRFIAGMAGALITAALLIIVRRRV